jgi:alanine dehydrogenase
MTGDLLFLESEAFRDLAAVEDYIDAVREGYRQHAGGGRTEPRTKLFHPHHEGMLMYYGALLPATGVMGVFIYVGEYENGDAWFLTHLADSDTGAPLALVDSPSVNPYKTGATGAVGVDALARADASTVAVIGTGAQAKGQLLATALVRDVTDVRAYSPMPEHRRQFASEMTDRLGADVRAADAANEAVRGADIVITATTATDPVFDGDALDDGAHVTAMGQSHPQRRELDAETVARAVYVPDHRERAEQVSGELLGAVRDGAVETDHLQAELGDVIAGTAPGRTSETAVTVFDSGGTGIESIAATYMVYERAKAAGHGVELSMTPGSEAFSEL